MTPHEQEQLSELTGAMREIRVLVSEIKMDLQSLTERMDAAIAAGSAHRMDLDRRLSVLEERSKTAITYRQMMLWLGGVGGAAAGGGHLLTRLLGGG